MSGTPARRPTTVGGYLAARLRQCGVAHLFGLPGDFSMPLLDELLAGGLEWVGATNELNAAYAADGYARRRGLGAVVTTFGVGELSAINAVAGAYAESVPLVQVTGAPPTTATVAGTPLHHTLLDGDLGHFARAYREVTAHTEVLRVDTAAAQVDRALQVALDELLPVHLTVPRDVATAALDAASCSRLSRPLHCRASDPEALADLRAALVRLLDGIDGSPTALVGRLAVRRGLRRLVRDLAESGVRVATLLDAKGILDETHPSALGTYVGALTADAPALEAVEHGDCPVLVGTVLSDLVTGGFTSHLKPAVVLDLHEAHVADLVLPGVELRDALAALVDVLKARGAARPTETCPSAPVGAAQSDAPLTQRLLWAEVQAWLPEEALLVADAGSSYFGAADLRLPRGAELVGQPAWASIGYTIPALLGLALGGRAHEQRRPVLIIGDGAAQLTVQELTTVLARRIPAVVLLLDNAGYTVERFIHCPDAAYQDVVPWDWTALVQALSPHHDVRATRVASVGVLRGALAVADRERDRFHFLHVQLPRDDAPRLLASVAAGLAAG